MGWGAQRRECRAVSTGDRARTRRPSTPPARSPRGGTEPPHGRPHDRAVQGRLRHVHQQRNITRRRLARLALVTHSRALHSYAPRNSNTRRDGLYSARRSSEATPWPAPYPRQGPGGPSPLCGERKRPPRTKFGARWAGTDVRETIPILLALLVAQSLLGGRAGRRGSPSLRVTFTKRSKTCEMRAPT